MTITDFSELLSHPSPAWAWRPARQSGQRASSRYREGRLQRIWKWQKFELTFIFCGRCQGPLRIEKSHSLTRAIVFLVFVFICVVFVCSIFKWENLFRHKEQSYEQEQDYVNVIFLFSHFTFSPDVRVPGRGRGVRCPPVVSLRPVKWNHY